MPAADSWLETGPADAARGRPRTRVVTLVFTDMADSTALKHRLGDRASAALIQKHHQLLRETLADFPAGQEIETAGDSFMLVFSTPSDAVQFALLLQARTRILNQHLETPVADRIGLHMGEVVAHEAAGSRKPQDLYGIQIDTCARVMSLANGGQILMTRAVFDSGRQVLKGEDIEGVGALEWLHHGQYSLKGLDEPVEICEVREMGRATVPPPTQSEKAQKQMMSAAEEQVLGWRPAVGQCVPHTRWLLEEKLGEGGFGEVWLGRHQHTKERRVFKFCFHAERVRFLKREMTLFRLLKERAGDHPHLVRLHDFYLEQPPYYVEMDYVAGRDLARWCAEQGGVEAIPIQIRIQLVAEAAEGLQAAHEAGIVHRDIKPANILIERRASTERHGEIANEQSGVFDCAAKVADFGIGQVVSEECLKGITRAGFTQTIVADSSSSRTGTHLYMAPELFAGKPATVRSDLYALGVVLYQLLMGDLTRPVITDWARGISDPLWREDLERCFAGEPMDRFGSAAEFAKNLRALPARRQELARRNADRSAMERAAYRRGVARTAVLAATLVVLFAFLSIYAFMQSRTARSEKSVAEEQRAEARRLLYFANMNLAQHAWQENQVGRVQQLLRETRDSPQKNFEWYYWQRRAHSEVLNLVGHRGSTHAAAWSDDGRRIATAGADRAAVIWDAAKGQPLRILRGHAETVEVVVFSPDNQRVLTVSSDRTKIWDVNIGTELATFNRGEQVPVKAAAFSGDGKRIVVGMGKVAKLLDSANGEPLQALEGHTDSVLACAFSPDGRKIATGSAWGDGSIRLWDAATGRELLTLREPGRGIMSVVFSADSQKLLSAGTDGTTVWDATSGNALLALKETSSTVIRALFAFDDRHILTSGIDSAVRLWDAATGKELRKFQGVIGRIRGLALSPDGRRFVAAGDNIKIWETFGDLETKTLRGHSDAVDDLVITPDGSRLISASNDGTAKVWDLRAGRELLTLRGHTRDIKGVSFSAAQNRIATVSLDQTLRVWDASTGEAIRTIQTGKRLWKVQFSPDGTHLVTGGYYDETVIRVWDSASGEEKGQCIGHDGAVSALAFSADGRWLLSGSLDRTATLWNFSTRQAVHQLKAHKNQLVTVAFAPDGQRALTGSLDGSAILWDAASGKKILTLPGHVQGVLAAKVFPDGSRLLTGGARLSRATLGRRHGARTADVESR